MKYILLTMAFIINSVSVCHAFVQEEKDRDRIIRILKEAYQRDQAPRMVIDSLMRNGVTDGNLYLPAVYQQREADSINIKVVLPIVDSLYKYQIYDLDPIVYECCWIVIQHAGDEIMVKYARFVEQLAKRDIISSSSYMAFIDRLQVNRSKAQIYGYQFKRLANGILIQYPILKGQKKRWKELGCYSDMKDLLPADYTVNYRATPINKDQFVILGFLYKGENDWPIEDLVPLKNTQILIDKRKKTTTDSNGFFQIVMSKKKLPAYVEVLINGMPLKYEIAHCEDDDFSISTGYFSNGKINVISE